jgi:UDPglucose 6-dehydrogenase
MDRRSAKYTKYAANAMLATRISFMNELANLAEREDADIGLVRQSIGGDPCISAVSVSGMRVQRCLPKDVKALWHTGKGVGCGVQAGY